MHSFIGTPTTGVHFTFAWRAWWHLKDHFVPHPRNNYQPHVLHHRTLTVLSVLLLTAKVFSISALQFAEQAAPVFASEITQSSVLELTNASRSQEGLPSLQYNEMLQRAAQAKADDMAARKYFSHTTPDGKTPWTFFEAAGYAYQSAGENLAVHFADVEPLQDAWMNSPGHRANIMSPKYTEMGVGIARGVYEGYESIFVVEMFGLPATQEVAQAPRVMQSAQVKDAESTVPAFSPRTARAAVEETALPAVVEPTALVKPARNGFAVEVTAPADTVKALVVYGQKARMLIPKADGTWQTTVSFESLQGTTPVVQLYSLEGVSKTLLLGSVETGVIDQAYAPRLAEPSIQAWGHTVAVGSIETKVYIAVIALLLTALIIALAVHEHMRHIRLVANASFVVFFAALLLVF